MQTLSPNQSRTSRPETQAPPQCKEGAGLNVHVYLGPPRFASRILKITDTLIRRGIFDRVVLIATERDGGPLRESLGRGREAWRVPRKYSGDNFNGLAKALGIVLWSIAVMRALRGLDVACINAHSLSILPLCVFLKVVKRSKLVYDTHELETATVAAGRARRAISRVLERFLMHFVDETSVVNDSIADWYKRSYRRKIWVVRNVPFRTESAPVRTYKLRHALQIDDDCPVFLFQGGMSKGRGIHLLLEAFEGIPDKHLVFMGYGALTSSVQTYSTTVSNIHYHPAVPPAELNEYTADVDVGMCTFENSCLNHYLALPNKLFEYLVCGVPILVSDFPEMRRVVSNLDCGWCSRVDVDSIRQLVSSIDLDSIREKRTNIARNRNKFGWQLEEEALVGMYRRMYPSGSTPI